MALKGFINALVFLAGSAALACGIEIHAPETGPLDIPPRNDILIDGDLDDWSTDAFAVVRLFSDETGRRGTVDANIRLAWSRTHLLLAATVVDDIIAEAPGFSLWQGDALTVHGSSEAGENQILFMLTPGIGPRGEAVEPRTLVNDRRANPAYKDVPFEPEYATRQTADGYQMEVALPLASYGLAEPKVGDVLSLQMEIKDREHHNEQPDLQWNAGQFAIRDPGAFNTIRLANLADRRPQLTAGARLVDEHTAEILVYSDASLNGTPLTADFEGKSITASLIARPDEAFAFVRFSTPFTGKEDMPWAGKIFQDGQLLSGFDFNLVPWVDSSQDFAPIPSISSMKSFEADRLQSNYSDDAVLAIGSSSIRMWDTIQEDLQPWEIIKRGFGGSAMGDVVGAYKYLVDPYPVNRFLIYEGDTEAGRNFPETFVGNAEIFVERLLKERPDAKIVFLTPKPSPARFDLWDKAYKTANEGLAALVKRHKQVYLIDVATPLFDSEGKLREELFRSDGVHLNAEGYRIWTRIIKQQLNDIFGSP
ncbi:MAG: hypothetical protein KJT03_09820 [Verrucomicrobiae bacterium]|nr:hypothetical protein [Verrucomicrobiae bacterium]